MHMNGNWKWMGEYRIRLHKILLVFYAILWLAIINQTLNNLQFITVVFEPTYYGGRCLYVECKLFALQTKKKAKKAKAKNSFKGFKRPKNIFAIKYYIIEIKTLCIPLKNNYFKQNKKYFESKINAFEHKKTFWLHFPPLVKLSNGLPLVPFSLHLGHAMRVTFVKSKTFCIANKNNYSETNNKAKKF